jgi:hypothetical protein
VTPSSMPSQAPGIGINKIRYCNMGRYANVAEWNGPAVLPSPKRFLGLQSTRSTSMSRKTEAVDIRTIGIDTDPAAGDLLPATDTSRSGEDR